MNPGIVISFVIGGLMLLSIAAFNINLAQTSQEITITSINHSRVNDIAEVMVYDFERLGYNANPTLFTSSKPIVKSTSQEIEFSVSDTDVIHWYVNPSQQVNSTTNPNDFYLYRNDGTNITSFPVTHFELNYFDSDNNVLSNPSSITDLRDFRIEVEIIIESSEPARSNLGSGQNQYARTVYRRTFIPANVNKPW